MVFAEGRGETRVAAAELREAAFEDEVLANRLYAVYPKEPVA